MTTPQTGAAGTRGRPRSLMRAGHHSGGKFVGQLLKIAPRSDSNLTAGTSTN